MTEVINILVVVEVAHVSWHTIEVTHILCLCHLLTGTKGLIHLLSMTGTNYLNVVICMEDFFYSLSQNFNSGSRGFLYEQIARIGMSECKHDKIDSFVKRHHKASHFRHCNGHGLACLNLFDE